MSSHDADLSNSATGPDGQLPIDELNPRVGDAEAAGIKGGLTVTKLTEKASEKLPLGEVTSTGKGTRVGPN